MQKLLFGVGAPSALFVFLHKGRSCHKGAGVELDLIGQEARIFDKGPKVLDVFLRRRSFEVHHQVRMDLEAEEADQEHRAGDLFGRCGTAVDIEDVLAGGLDADLHLRAAKRAEGVQGLWRDGIRPCLDHKADHAVRGVLVCLLDSVQLAFSGRHPGELGFLCPIELLPGRVVGLLSLPDTLLLRCDEAFEGGVRVHIAEVTVALVAATERLFGCGPFVQSTEELAHEPELVSLGIVAPGAAEDDELDLVGRMPHLLQGLEAQCHLKIRVEEVLLCPLAGRLVAEIAFRHPQVCRTVETVRGTGPGAGDHGDRGDTRRGAPWLHLEACMEACLEGSVNLPACPELGPLFLDPDAGRKKAPLAEALAPRKLPAVAAHDAVQLGRG